MHDYMQNMEGLKEVRMKGAKSTLTYCSGSKHAIIVKRFNCVQKESSFIQIKQMCDFNPVKGPCEKSKKKKLHKLGRFLRSSQQ